MNTRSLFCDVEDVAADLRTTMTLLTILSENYFQTIANAVKNEDTLGELVAENFHDGKTSYAYDCIRCYPLAQALVSAIDNRLETAVTMLDQLVDRAAKERMNHQ